MSINILYIGNKLAHKGRTATTIDTLCPLLKKEGYRLRYASSIKNISGRMLHMMRAVFLSRNWAHYVLIDTYSTRSFWYAITISRMCQSLGLKYIPILHGGNLPSRIDKNPSTLKKFFDNAYQVVSPSGFLIDAFAKAEYKNIIKIPNNITIEDYPFKIRENLQPKLLWVRSFAEIYNPKMAIEVLKIISKKYPNAQLCMVGPDKDGSMIACKQIAQNENLDVQFAGLLTREQWIALSSAYDIFINTSRFDNLPVSLIEAMALGLPVVSTNVGGIKYLMNSQNGKLVDSHNPQEMVDAIFDVMNNKEKSMSLIQKARSTAEQYDWSQVKQQWLQLLQG